MSAERPEQSTEVVAEDDAVIGKAFKWSGLALLGIIGIVVLVVSLNRDDPTEEVVHEKDVGSIENLSVDVEALPEVRFSDVTEAAGIDFVHTTGAAGEKLLPETMGGGAAFFDKDGDGDADLFFVNGAPWPWSGASPPGHRLYENDGTGHFTDVTEGSGLEGGFYGMGVAAGDYDGDGRVDLFVTGVGTNHLFRNTGSGFVDVTAEAGVAGSEEQWTTSAGFFDLEGDGDLDLFVCRYVAWSRDIDAELAFSLNGNDRAYGPPTNYGGTYSSLFRNAGDGTFQDISEEAGIHVTNSATNEPMGKALGVSFADFDRDGRIDLVVANDTVQNHLFHTQGRAASRRSARARASASTTTDARRAPWASTSRTSATMVSSASASATSRTK